MPRVVSYGVAPQQDSGNVPFTLNFEIDGQAGSVDIPVPDGNAQLRCWLQCSPNHGGVLCYYLLEGDLIVLMRKPNTYEWMSSLPDDRALADLTIPGTHESASLFGGFISQCQTVDVAQQLRDGVRFFDIRLSAQNGDLQTFHGPQPQNSNLRTQMGWIQDFLKEHPRETVVCCIKEEVPPEMEHFAQAVFDQLSESGMWRFDETLPTLGEARGRPILFSRFNKRQNEQYPNGMGIHPTCWPNNVREGFDWDCYGTPFRIQDWYEIGGSGSNGEKTYILTSHLEPTCGARGPGLGADHPYTLAFATASKFPDASPSWVARGASGGGVDNTIGGAVALFAKIATQGQGGGDPAEIGVNARFTKWLLQKASEGCRPRATILLDFYQSAGQGDGVAMLLAAMNQIE